MRTRFVTEGMHGWVVETEESDGEGVWRGEKEIVGHASFLRLGRDEGAGKWRSNGGWGYGEFASFFLSFWGVMARLESEGDVMRVGVPCHDVSFLIREKNR